MNKKTILGTALLTAALVATASTYASNVSSEYSEERSFDRSVKMEKMNQYRSEGGEFRWNAHRFLEADPETKSKIEDLRTAKLEWDTETYEALKEELGMGQRPQNWQGFGKRMWKGQWQWNCNSSIN